MKTFTNYIIIPLFLESLDMKDGKRLHDEYIIRLYEMNLRSYSSEIRMVQKRSNKYHAMYTEDAR